MFATNHYLQIFQSTITVLRTLSLLFVVISIINISSSSFTSAVEIEWPNAENIDLFDSFTEEVSLLRFTNNIDSTKSLTIKNAVFSGEIVDSFRPIVFGRNQGLLFENCTFNFIPKQPLKGFFLFENSFIKFFNCTFYNRKSKEYYNNGLDFPNPSSLRIQFWSNSTESLISFENNLFVSSGPLNLNSRDNISGYSYRYTSLQEMILIRVVSPHDSSAPASRTQIEDEILTDAWKGITSSDRTLFYFGEFRAVNNRIEMFSYVREIFALERSRAVAGDNNTDSTEYRRSLVRSINVSNNIWQVFKTQELQSEIMWSDSAEINFRVRTCLFNPNIFRFNDISRAQSYNDEVERKYEQGETDNLIFLTETFGPVLLESLVFSNNNITVFLTSDIHLSGLYSGGARAALQGVPTSTEKRAEYKLTFNDHTEYDINNNPRGTTIRIENNLLWKVPDQLETFQSFKRDPDDPDDKLHEPEVECNIVSFDQMIMNDIYLIHVRNNSYHAANKLVSIFDFETIYVLPFSSMGRYPQLRLFSRDIENVIFEDNNGETQAPIYPRMMQLKVRQSRRIENLGNILVRNNHLKVEYRMQEGSGWRASGPVSVPNYYYSDSSATGGKTVDEKFGFRAGLDTSMFAILGAAVSAETSDQVYDMMVTMKGNITIRDCTAYIEAKGFSRVNILSLEANFSSFTLPNTGVLIENITINVIKTDLPTKPEQGLTPTIRGMMIGSGFSFCDFIIIRNNNIFAYSSSSAVGLIFINTQRSSSKIFSRYPGAINSPLSADSDPLTLGKVEGIKNFIIENNTLAIRTFHMRYYGQIATLYFFNTRRLVIGNFKIQNNKFEVKQLRHSCPSGAGGIALFWGDDSEAGKIVISNNKVNVLATWFDDDYLPMNEQLDLATSLTNGDRITPRSPRGPSSTATNENAIDYKNSGSSLYHDFYGPAAAFIVSSALTTPDLSDLFTITVKRRLPFPASNFVLREVIFEDNTALIVQPAFYVSGVHFLLSGTINSMNLLLIKDNVFNLRNEFYLSPRQPSTTSSTTSTSSSTSTSMWDPNQGRAVKSVFYIGCPYGRFPLIKGVTTEEDLQGFTSLKVSFDCDGVSEINVENITIENIRSSSSSSTFLDVHNVALIGSSLIPSTQLVIKNINNIGSNKLEAFQNVIKNGDNPGAFSSFSSSLVSFFGDSTSSSATSSRFSVGKIVLDSISFDDENFFSVCGQRKEMQTNDLYNIEHYFSASPLVSAQKSMTNSFPVQIGDIVVRNVSGTIRCMKSSSSSATFMNPYLNSYGSGFNNQRRFLDLITSVEFPKHVEMRNTSLRIIVDDENDAREIPPVTILRGTSTNDNNVDRQLRISADVSLLQLSSVSASSLAKRNGNDIADLALRIDPGTPPSRADQNLISLNITCFMWNEKIINDKSAQIKSSNVDPSNIFSFCLQGFSDTLTFSKLASESLDISESSSPSTSRSSSVKISEELDMFETSDGIRAAFTVLGPFGAGHGPAANFAKLHSLLTLRQCSNHSILKNYPLEWDQNVLMMSLGNDEVLQTYVGSTIGNLLAMGVAAVVISVIIGVWLKVKMIRDLGGVNRNKNKSTEDDERELEELVLSAAKKRRIETSGALRHGTRNSNSSPPTNNDSSNNNNNKNNNNQQQKKLLDDILDSMRFPGVILVFPFVVGFNTITSAGAVFSFKKNPLASPTAASGSFDFERIISIPGFVIFFVVVPGLFWWLIYQLKKQKVKLIEVPPVQGSSAAKEMIEKNEERVEKLKEEVRQLEKQLSSRRSYSSLPQSQQKIIKEQLEKARNNLSRLKRKVRNQRKEVEAASNTNSFDLVDDQKNGVINNSEENKQPTPLTTPRDPFPLSMWQYLLHPANEYDSSHSYVIRNTFILEPFVPPMFILVDWFAAAITALAAGISLNCADYVCCRTCDSLAVVASLFHFSLLLKMKPFQTKLDKVANVYLLSPLTLFNAIFILIENEIVDKDKELLPSNLIDAESGESISKPIISLMVEAVSQINLYVGLINLIFLFYPLIVELILKPLIRHLRERKKQLLKIVFKQEADNSNDSGTGGRQQQMFSVQLKDNNNNNINYEETLLSPSSKNYGQSSSRRSHRDSQTTSNRWDSNNMNTRNPSSSAISEMLLSPIISSRSSPNEVAARSERNRSSGRNRPSSSFSSSYYREGDRRVRRSKTQLNDDSNSRGGAKEILLKNHKRFSML